MGFGRVLWGSVTTGLAYGLCFGVGWREVVLLGGSTCAQGMGDTQGMRDAQGDADPVPWKRGRSCCRARVGETKGKGTSS